MPYITEIFTQEQVATAIDVGKDLAETTCDFCGRNIIVPASRLNQSCYCTENCFRARYGCGSTL
jgi:hypothetical protein